jgi:hypothetical protein
MQEGIARKITGWLFIAAAVLFWGGWMLLHTHIGQYFQADDFPAVDEHLAYWISMFRMHIFGVVVTVLAIIAFGSMFTESPARILIWPGAAVVAGGMFVWAAASAFYYHFGAWGAIDMHAKAPAESARFADSLKISTEYVTCLVRFGRVFFGLGQVVLAAGLLATGLWAAWIWLSAAALGIAAMALTMGLPDRLEYYRPIFHLSALWLVAIGLVLLGA